MKMALKLITYPFGIVLPRCPRCGAFMSRNRKLCRRCREEVGQ